MENLVRKINNAASELESCLDKIKTASQNGNNDINILDTYRKATRHYQEIGTFLQESTRLVLRQECRIIELRTILGISHNVTNDPDFDQFMKEYIKLQEKHKKLSTDYNRDKSRLMFLQNSDNFRQPSRSAQEHEELFELKEKLKKANAKIEKLEAEKARIQKLLEEDWNRPRGEMQTDRAEMNKEAIEELLDGIVTKY